MNRRDALQRMTSAAVLAPLAAAAQPTWPSRPIQMILGYPPGGSSDIIARELVPGMSKVLGQPFVMEYRGGAGATLGADAASKAVPDGYALSLIDASPLTIAPHLRKLAYDPRSSFSPIASVGYGEMVLLANPNLQIRSIEALISHARTRPGKLSYASSGIGTTQHLCGELFKKQTGLFIVHVPYRGAASASTAVIGGEVELAVTIVGAVLPFIAAGRVVPLAVTTASRSPALPNVPTLSEAGLTGFDVRNWIGLFGPAGVPAATAGRLASVTSEVVRSADFAARMATHSIQTAQATAAELRGWIEQDYSRWGQLIKANKIIAE